MHAAQLSELAARLGDLVEDRTTLAYALKREAESLRELGPLHLQSTADAAADFLRRLSELESAVRELDDSQLAAQTGHEPNSLPDLSARVATLQASLPARKLLQDVARLQGDVDSSDMQVVRSVAEELETKCNDRTLTDCFDEQLDTHPLAALLRLVGEADQMDDDSWDRDQQSVRDAFGPTIAVAAARGRLSLVGTSPNNTDQHRESTGTKS